MTRRDGPSRISPSRDVGRTPPKCLPSPGGVINRLQRTAGNTIAARLLLQRACRDCEEEKAIHAKHATSNAPEVSREVESYLGQRHAGQPLAPATRAFFDARFERDFGDVRVHTDAAAARSAAALDARAYTFGSNVYFGASQYAPETTEGRRLLAHELTHVVQQGGGPATISRYASVTCTAGTHGAPANADALIEAAEILAGLVITAADMDLTLLRLDAVLPGLGAGGGFTMPTSARMTNYQNSFGLPPRVSGGRFRDRLGGGTFSTQAEALVNEIDALQNRYQRIADRISAGIRYRCIGGSTTIGDCEGHCRGRTATACLGQNLIMLCPKFWTDSMDTRAKLLIHEVAHLAFSIRHGRNFTHADCYANYAADATTGGWNGIPACVP